MATEIYNSGDYDDFYAACRGAAEVSGAMIVEHFTCPHCAGKQVTAHAFKPDVPCGSCGAKIKSRVPQIPKPGEVTADMFTRAITALRRGTPKINRETIDWIEKQEGSVRSIALTYSTHAVHQALDALQDIARGFAGSHGFSLVERARPETDSRGDGGRSGTKES